MLRDEKIPSALKVLQQVLVRARLLALQEAPHKEIAGLLDYAEYLPQLMLDTEDQTTRFREVLTEIGERFECGYLTTEFDRPNGEDMGN